MKFDTYYDIVSGITIKTFVHYYMQPYAKIKESMICRTLNY